MFRQWVAEGNLIGTVDCANPAGLQLPDGAIRPGSGMVRDSLAWLHFCLGSLLFLKIVVRSLLRRSNLRRSLQNPWSGSASIVTLVKARSREEA